jgi:hypothetical protein
MGGMKKWMVAAALVAGTVGLGATQASAARIGFGVYVGGPRAYVPPCPGPGYAWTAGYYANGYWVPGFWRAPEARFVVHSGYGWGHPVYDRHFDNRHYDAEHFRR